MSLRLLLRYLLNQRFRRPNFVNKNFLRDNRQNAHHEQQWNDQPTICRAPLTLITFMNDCEILYRQEQIIVVAHFEPHLRGISAIFATNFHAINGTRLYSKQMCNRNSDSGCTRNYPTLYKNNRCTCIIQNKFAPCELNVQMVEE